MSAAVPCGELFCPCGCGAWFGYCVLIGRHVSTAKPFAMPALSDPEEPNPAYFAPPMNDAETTDTMSPPTDREAPTQSDNPIPRREAINPPPKPTADSLLIDCMNQLLEGNESLKLIRRDLLDLDGAFAERQREHRRELVRELKEAVIPRVVRLEETVAELRKQVEALQTNMATQRTAYETKFAEQQACLDVINDMLPDLEKALADARSAQAPSAEQA
jgi:hypothetical protein